MGCPDWPRCFDRWIPPTDVSQLPAGMDPALFNVRLAWTEYINRLVGVSTGIFIFVTLILAYRHYRGVPRVLWPTVAAFVGVAYEGWLGSRVVASELEPLMVTAHLVVALIVVSLLLYATVCAFFPDGRPLKHLPRERRRLGGYGALALVLLLSQIGLGAWLRGTLEVISRSDVSLPRGEWIAHAGWVDALHRTSAWLVAGSLLFLFVQQRRLSPRLPWLNRAGIAALGLVGFQIVLGLGLVDLDLPPLLQVLHLTVASLLMGVLTLFIMLAFRLPTSLGAPIHVPLRPSPDVKLS